jgi:UPF0755 protein
MAAGLRSFLVLGAGLILVGALTLILGWSRYTLPGPLAEPRTVVIPRGAGVNDIARQLWQAGIIAEPYSFQFGTRVDDTATRLRSGEYAFPAAVTPRDAAAMLAAGRTVVRRVTLVEGQTTAQIIALIAAAEGLEGDIGEHPGEGEFLPETYFYSWGDARRQIVARGRRAMAELVADLWAKRAADLPLRNPAEAVALASIVEKETSIGEERPRVAAVFINRLRAGMKLQADPTVIYGITQGKGPLDRPISRADLETPHRWNTYVITGLPPTPIANPGRASLEAVLRPMMSDEIYFVADGTGRHVFARTLAEHNRNVARLREVERSRSAPPQ